MKKPIQFFKKIKEKKTSSHDWFSFMWKPKDNFQFDFSHVMLSIGFHCENQIKNHPTQG